MIDQHKINYKSEVDQKNVKENKRKTYSQIAYETIKSDLMNGRYDNYVNGRKIAMDMEVGYTPIREALQRLEKEGLLERIPNGGYFIKRIGWTDINRIFQVRECVELFVWEQLFDVIDSQSIKNMEMLHEEEIKALRDENIEKCRDIDTKFHAIFLEKYNNKDLLYLYYNSREKQMICTGKPLGLYDYEAVHEHQKIIELLKDGKKEECIKTLQNHILNFRKRMQSSCMKPEIYRDG